eukprot:Nitzschia sp. Nitz4//scaffold277_size25017//16017//16705//NITZ4_008349-RA/size25017-snap-gene-0.37-mRNA-1//-1//CDS//3329545350//5201//frame0
MGGHGLSVNEDEISDSLLPDLFLNTTVAVASIDGFTAWSSVREPVPVFQLLEVLFESFDEVADSRNIEDLDCNSESRWIEWNTDVLRRLLVKVIAGRQVSRMLLSSSFMEEESVKSADMPLEEVQEIIQLPHFDKDAV